jgi:predicted nucleic acid-binding protein
LIVLDASLMVGWLLNEPMSASRPQIQSWLINDAIMVPAHWSAEVGNALTVSKRRGRIADSELDDILLSLDAFQITTQLPPATQDFDLIIRLAQAYRLTFYDTLYVRLALDMDAALATLDNDMRAAARDLSLTLIPV